MGSKLEIMQTAELTEILFLTNGKFCLGIVIIGTKSDCFVETITIIFTSGSSGD